MAEVSVEKMMAMLEEDLAERVSRSWCLQDKAERKHRLNTIIALSTELEAIRRTSRFNSALGEAAIEAVIEGDWDDAEEWVKHFTFEDECEDVRDTYAPLWEKFRIILMTAVADKKAMIPGVRVKSN